MADEPTPDQTLDNNATQQQNTAPDYAKLFAEQQAQNAILQQQTQQLIEQNMKLQLQPQASQSQQNVAPAVDPYAGFEPETAKAIKNVVGSVEAQFKQQNAALQQEIAQLRAGTAPNAIAQAAGPNANPQVLKWAQDLYSQLQGKGVPVNAQEVWDMAYGKAMREGKIQNVQQQRGTPPVLNGGSAQPTNVSRTRPANFDSLPLREQVKHIEADPNFHDIEF